MKSKSEILSGRQLENTQDASRRIEEIAADGEKKRLFEQQLACCVLVFNFLLPSLGANNYLWSFILGRKGKQKVIVVLRMRWGANI